jgi:hypothetical protein
MTLLDAKEHDPRRARRNWMIAGTAALLLLALAILWFWPTGRFRFWREWSIANQFFAAIEHRHFDAAYGLYNGDPEWKQHPEKYQQYSLARFMQDWGPSGDFGAIVSHQIDCAIEPPKSGFASASGVVIVVRVNRRPDQMLLWIEKGSHTITTSPWDMEFLTRHSPLVRAACYRAG